MTISAAPNKEKVLRAAAQVANAETPTFNITLNEAWGSFLNIEINFTLGSLTDATFRFHFTQTGGNEAFVADEAGNVVEVTMTASGWISVPIHGAGWRYFYMTTLSNGDPTGSSATITARYLQHGSQNTTVA